MPFHYQLVCHNRYVKHAQSYRNGKQFLYLSVREILPDFVWGISIYGSTVLC
jgi:hypothetical protein